MFKHQNLFWSATVILNVVQGMTCQLSPMARGAAPFNCGFFQCCNSPFEKLINEQGSADGTQNPALPLPTCRLFPCGSNGLMDFSNCGPGGSPTFGCPPFYVSLWRPFGPVGNCCPMLMGPNMRQENGNFRQRVRGDPSASFNNPYEQNSGCEARCEATDQNEKTKQCSTKYRTTKRPRCTMRDKMCIV